MIRFIVILFTVALMPHSASAKRSAPAKVESVIHEGVRYVAPNDDGRRGYIQAWDVQTNKKLWELTLFINRIDPKLEQDVQWVFVKSLSIRDGMLMVTSERGKTYQVDLKTKTVTQFDAAQSAAPMQRLNAMRFVRRWREPSRIVRLPRTTTSPFAQTHFICVEILMATVTLT